MIERKSNYEIQADKCKLEFINWNHEDIAKKFNLKYDNSYLYIYFFSQKYRLNRITGDIEKTNDNITYIKARHNEIMTILDLMSYSKDNLKLSGNWSKVTSLKGIIKTGGVSNHDDLFLLKSSRFKNRINDLEKACERLNGKKISTGDLGYIINVFEFLPIMIVFYEEDFDFPAEFKILWDENILDYMHYETTFYAVSHLFEKIEELAAN